MDSLKEWLSADENNGKVTLYQLQVILDELNSNQFGIKASGVFTITYNLVANIIGITVTYFIICIQVQ